MMGGRKFCPKGGIREAEGLLDARYRQWQAGIQGELWCGAGAGSSAQIDLLKSEIEEEIEEAEGAPACRQDQVRICL